MIKQRLLTALVLLPLIVIIWFGGPAYSLTVAVAAALGLLEFFHMKGFSWRHPLTLFGLLWVLLLILAAHFATTYSLLVLSAAVVFSLVWVVSRSSVEQASHDWAWTLAGIIYVGWMLSYFIPLRALEGGRDWVFVALFATFAVDTSAFFIGRAWGRHPLAPRVSPGKTWEGTIGGFLAAIAACLILAAVLPSVAVGWKVAVLGVLIGVFAQLGDLAESMLKRSAGVKDASRLMPGHGGLLDRLDSIIFSVVVVYYYVLWVVV
ncbi:MAG: CDP-archaeol synthase [Chloroflexota bacterium]|nr:CDP-archaeol synthase [Chloroflexota bacterium]